MNTKAVDGEYSQNPDHLLLGEICTKPPGVPDDVCYPLVSPPPGLCLLVSLVVHQQTNQTEYSEIFSISNEKHGDVKYSKITVFLLF